jgi:hypothetical protein
MKLSQIAAKPQLVKLTIDDETTIQTYGEAVDFWTWDRQPLEMFMKLAEISQEDPVKVVGIVKEMILDEDGKQIINGDVTIPSALLMKIVQKIVETLGK